MFNVSLDSWTRLPIDVFRLGLESCSLVELRLSKMASGGVPAIPEAMRMAPEKLDALRDAQRLVANTFFKGEPFSAPEQAVALYRGRVQDNRTRLLA